MTSSGETMETQSAASNEIQFRDIEIKSLSGWLGLFIHLIIVPVLFLGSFGLYAFGAGGVVLGGFLQMCIGILWFVMWNPT